MLTKKQKIDVLQKQIDQIKEIKTERDFKKWRYDAESAVENIFGKNTRQTNKFEYAFLSWDLAVHPSEISDFPRALSEKSDAYPILESFITEINQFEDSTSLATSKNSLGLEHLCNRFHLVARQLRSRHDNRETLDVEDEYDVQDLFHALLTLEYDDIRPEEWIPSYAGGASRTDFLLKDEQTLVEIKKTRKGLGAKKVGEQLIIDIARYKKHPDCKTLICFVYDPEGRISNPHGLENDLNGEHDGVNVKVIIRPSGL